MMFRRKHDPIKAIRSILVSFGRNTENITDVDIERAAIELGTALARFGVNQDQAVRAMKHFASASYS